MEQPSESSISDDFLCALILPLDRSAAPFIIPWLHTPETPSGVRSFTDINEWRQYILGLNLEAGVCRGAARKFRRAQKLYFLAWLDGDLIKASELVALTALELALKDKYGAQILGSRPTKNRNQPISLRELLKHLIEKDGLTDGKLPIVQKYGCTVVWNLYETDEARDARLYIDGDRNKGKRAMAVVPPMTLDEIRNRAAHGDPFDTAPWGGLFEVVRDLIHYAFRDTIAEWRLRGIHGGNLEAFLDPMVESPDEDQD